MSYRKYWPIVVFMILLYISCRPQPRGIRLGKYVRVKSIIETDTGTTSIVHEGTLRLIISLTDNGLNQLFLGFGYQGSPGLGEDFICEIQSWDGVIADLKPCLENERCIGLECEYPVCIVPWNGDTLRIVGDGWENYDQEWDSDSCDEIHLYLYEEAFYEF